MQTLGGERRSQLGGQGECRRCEAILEASMACHHEIYKNIMKKIAVLFNCFRPVTHPITGLLIESIVTQSWPVMESQSQ